MSVQNSFLLFDIAAHKSKNPNLSDSPTPTPLHLAPNL